MKANRNILQRPLDYDLKEDELEEFYRTPEQSTSHYQDALVEQLANDYILPEKARLLTQKKKELDSLEMKPKSKQFVLPLRLLEIAASVTLLVAILMLMRPSLVNIVREV